MFVKCVNVIEKWELSFKTDMRNQEERQWEICNTYGILLTSRNVTPIHCPLDAYKSSFAWVASVPMATSESINEFQRID